VIQDALTLGLQVIPATDRQHAGLELQRPADVNGACDWLMRVDEAAMRQGVSLPFGGSLLAVARKQ